MHTAVEEKIKRKGKNGKQEGEPRVGHLFKGADSQSTECAL